MLNRIVRELTKTRHHKSQIRSLSTNEPHLPLKDVMVVTLEQAVGIAFDAPSHGVPESSRWRGSRRVILRDIMIDLREMR